MGPGTGYVEWAICPQKQVTARDAKKANPVSANKGLPPPLGRGVCETKSKNGRSRPRKPFISRVFCAHRRIETMVSDHARPWSRGRSGDCDSLRDLAIFGPSPTLRGNPQHLCPTSLIKSNASRGLSGRMSLGSLMTLDVSNRGTKNAHELFKHKLFEHPQGSGTSRQNFRDIPDSSLPKEDKLLLGKSKRGLTNGGLSPKFSEKIGGKSFLGNRAFSGQIGTFSGPIRAFSGPIRTNSSAPHSHGGRAEIAPKGPVLAQLAPFGPSPRLLSPCLDFPDFERESTKFLATTPSRGRPPTPPGGLRTQRVNLCALFTFMIETQFMVCHELRFASKPPRLKCDLVRLEKGFEKGLLKDRFAFFILRQSCLF